MSEWESSQQQAEKNYIDSMLGVLTEELTVAATVQPETEVVSQVCTPETPDVVVPDNQYQIISVAGMKFALRVNDIAQILAAEQVTAQNQTFSLDGKQVKVLSLTDLLSLQADDVNYYLLLDDRQTAIACNSLVDINNIEPDNVCWKTEQSRHDWLAGTVRQQGIAILDIEVLQRA